MEGLRDVYLVSGVTIPRDAIGADDCSDYMTVCTSLHARVRRDIPTAWMGLCWKSESTMVSQIIVEGMASVWSSSAVNLHT